ncbi:MAG: VOC family protein [Bacteroidota bacterium]
MDELRPFHLAVPVKELTPARNFYRDVMGFEEGRSSDHWVDFNFFGHQFVIHEAAQAAEAAENPVDGHQVPVPHFGVVLRWEDWEALRDRLVAANTKFIIEPYIRFKGEVGEQATMFFLDPAGNALEFKAFKDDQQIFAK